MAAVIKTVNLTKRYGTLVALSNLNLEIGEGDCFGFIGPNGAGKTTTIKILATLLQPTWGEARICDFVVAAYNINGAARSKIVSDVLELTDLGYKKDALVDGLSRGMKQRLSIARVLVHDPKLLLLDEPAGNLDPRARIEMRELLKELRRMGKTILISSHILPELADLCNTVGIIERGELLYSGPVSDIVKRARTGTTIHVSVANNTEQAAAMLATLEPVQSADIENGVIIVALKTGLMDYSFIGRQLVSGGYSITMLREEEVNLETAFMRLTKGMVQ
jgi:ABC-2 type transport system ATP-binding protein